MIVGVVVFAVVAVGAIIGLFAAIFGALGNAVK
jgi:hypothetical protein